jgi:hypothetical protein
VGRSRHWLHSTAGLHIWYHLALFAVLGALALRASSRLSWRIVGVAAALLFGFATELSETGGKLASIEWGDVQMDCYGVAFGCFAVWLFSRTKPKTH